MYAVQRIPPNSSLGLPAIKQPSVYFGLGETGYVVADTKQLEVDYQQDGTAVESHYSGKDATGGVQLSSLIKRAAFALRLGDFNLLISSQITPKSRIMFVRDPLAMAEKAAPFLSFDHDPYAVINDGQIDWVVDGYTTTANYPYSQNASSQQVAVGSTLPGSYNYVRNSVKVIINAYTGQMTFYDVEPNDPIIQAYEAAFPHMFTPLSKMSPSLQAHLRYPEDIFSIQSAIFGRYHLTNPQAFYAASNAWQLSPTAGAGPQSQALLAENTYNSQGQLVSTTPARMAPQYQVYALPGTTQPTFTISNGFVPASQSSSVNGSNQNFNLTAWMVGQSDPENYGRLDVYETPQGTPGPANADAEISANKTVSADISLLDQKGSEVLLGETLMVPIANSMVYLRPLYVASTTNPQPNLQYVVAVLGKNVQIESSLSSVLSDLLQAGVSLPSGNGGPSTGTVPSAVTGYLSAAQTDYTNALAALEGAEPLRVPDGDSGHGAADHPGPASARRRRERRRGRRPRRRRCRTRRRSSPAKQTSTTSSSVPTSTEPRGSTPTTSPKPASTTSTSLASALPKP